MDITGLTIDFRFSNSEGWYGGFGVTRGAPASAPWSSYQAWTPRTDYTATAACTHQGDLYIARPGLSPTNWTSADTFEADTVDGYSRWVMVGDARSYAQEPYPLIGAELTFAIRALDGSGNALSDGATLTASSAANEFIVTNPAQGGVTLSIRPSRTENVAPGLYYYEMRAAMPSGRIDRIRYGLLTVDEGITR